MNARFGKESLKNMLSIRASYIKNINPNLEYLVQMVSDFAG